MNHSYRRHWARFAGQLAGLVLACGLAPSLPAAQSSGAGGPTGLGAVLDARGRLSVPPGFSGTLDATGFEMRTAADGTPIFVAKDSPDRANKLFGMAEGCNIKPDAIAVLPSGMVYFGGFFSLCGDVPALGVVSYDPRTRRFAALGDGLEYLVPDVMGTPEVLAFALSGSDLYVGGRFTHAGGAPANNVARWDGRAWSALGAGVDDRIYALAWSGNTLFAGGHFLQAGGQPARRIARWNGQAWNALGSGMDNDVSALAARGDEVYAAGRFTSAGGQPANRIARWNGSAWHALGSDFESGGGTLAFLGDDLINYGTVIQDGGVSMAGLSRWDGRAWSCLGTCGETTGAGRFAVSGNDLIATGRFDRVAGTLARNIARYRNGTWTALGVPGAQGIDDSASALAVSGDMVYVSGYFTEAGGVLVRNTAVFNGVGWSPLGTEKPASKAPSMRCWWMGIA